MEIKKTYALCTNDGGWVMSKKTIFGREKEVLTFGPRYGDICTVTGELNGHINLLEWDGEYNKNCFVFITEEEAVQLHDARKKEIFDSLLNKEQNDERSVATEETSGNQTSTK